MEYYLATLHVANEGDLLTCVDFRIKASNLVSAATKLKMFIDNYDYSAIFCFRSLCRLEFNKLSSIPCL